MTKDKKTLLAEIELALAGNFAIRSFDPPDCPIFLAAALPLHDGASGLKPRIPAGRGLTRLQALVSAGAEALELQATLAGNIDASQLVHSDGTDAVPAIDLASGRRRLLPARSVFLDYEAAGGGPAGPEADSTGCAAAETLAQAQYTAMLELIERDAMATWWYGRHRRRHLSVEIATSAVPRLVWWLMQRQRETRLIDIATDIAVPVVVAVSFEPDGSDIAIGCAAAGRQVDAAVSALLEMVQTEQAMIAGATSDNPELDTWRARANALRMIQFDNGEADAGPAVADMERPSVTTLVEAMRRVGLAPAVVDLTRTGSPLRVVRVVADGLSAMNRRLCPERIAGLAGLSIRIAGVRLVDAFESLEPY